MDWHKKQLKFEINGEDWVVQFVSPYNPYLVRLDGRGYTLGTCDDLLKIIFINERLPEEQVRKVLGHELTHASMFSYNIDLPIDFEEILAEIIAIYGEEIVYLTDSLFQNIMKKRGRI